MRLPPPLTGNSEKDRWLNELRGAVAAMQLRAGPGIIINEGTSGTHGTVVSSAARQGGGGQPPASDWFQGDWSPNANYVRGHGVVIRGGITAGLYICHTDAPAGTPAPSPSDFTNWTTVATGNAMGLWF